jgi:hypothetical protein
LDLVSIRPVLSGIIGAAIAAWLLRRLSRWVPVTCSDRPIKDVLYQHRWKVRLANALGFACLIGGVVLYKVGAFASNDWRGIGLAFGGACLVPTLVLVGASLPGGSRAIREALVAYAVGQNTPPMLQNAIIAVGIVIFFISIGALYAA